jgi:hypothetical protein
MTTTSNPRLPSPTELTGIRHALHMDMDARFDSLSIQDLIAQDVIIRDSYTSDGPGYCGRLAWITHGEPCFNTILGVHTNNDWYVIEQDLPTPEHERELKAIKGVIERFGEDCDRDEHTDVDTAWEILNSVRDAIAALYPPPKPKKFNVWINLIGTYEADDDGEAFDLAMNDIENREGMEISSHEIIEETS